MRRAALVAVVPIVAALGCASEDAPPASEVGPATPPAPAPAGVTAAEQPETWGEKYWVILQSDRDAAKVPPSLATLEAHPELALTPRRLPSSRFKNLMPCYNVVVADAAVDKAAALALSKRLTDLGVDNYVKNAGAYVGRRPAVDAWCATSGIETPTDGPWWTIAAGDATWLLLGEDDALAESARVGAPKPTMRDRPTWSAPLSAQTIGRWSVGDGVRVVGPSGAPVTCKILSFADLTTGIPHFGVLQDEADPRAPTCGEPSLAAQLDCDVPGTALALPTTAPAPVVWQPGAPVTDAASLAAARALFTVTPGWAEAATYAEGPLTDTITLTTVTAGAQTAWLAEARRAAEGACGGVDEAFFALIDPAKPAVARAGPFQASAGASRAVIDVGRGPELWLSAFPAQDALVSAGGARTQLDVAYCDCPC